MFSPIFKKVSLILTVLLFSFAIVTRASFSGTYTIDPSQTASASNYKNLTSASQDLLGQTRNDGGPKNGGAVTGAVIFNIADGVYNENMTIRTFSGVSSQSPITFQSASGDSSKVLIYNNSGASYSPDIIFDGCSHFTFNKLSFYSYGSKNYAFDILSSNDIRITNCKLYSTNDINSAAAAINFTFYGKIKSSHISITNCYFNTGYTAIGMYPGCISSASIKNNVFIGSNNAASVNCVGVWAESEDSLDIENNFIDLSASIPSGIVLNYCKGLVKGNRINMHTGSYSSGIALNYCDYMLVCNNMITSSHFAGSGVMTGVLLTQNKSCNFVNNTILMDSVNGSHAEFDLPVSIVFVSGSNLHFYNNNVINKAGNIAMALSGTKSSGDSFDFNNYIALDSLIRWDSKEYKTLSNYQSATGMDAHSKSITQQFSSDDDLHDNAMSMFGLGKHLSYIKDDIDGQIRDALNPCIGADETFNKDDIKLLTIIPSKTTLCAGDTLSFEAVVQNKGVVMQQNVKITSVLSGPQTDNFISIGDKGLNFFDFDTIQASKKLVLTKPGIYTLTTFTSISNDQNRKDDTMSVKISCVAAPVASFKIANICYHDSTRFTSTSLNTDSKTSYRWTLGDGELSNLKQVSVKYVDQKTYKVSLLVSNEGLCKDTVSQYVKILPRPNIQYTYSAKDYNVTFTPAELNAKVYFWKFGDGTGSLDKIALHQYLFYGNDFYNTTLIIQGANGCVDSSKKIINIQNSAINGEAADNIVLKVYPNPFSDKFELTYTLSHSAPVSISLFNVNGQQVLRVMNDFESEGIHNITIPTESLPQGIYSLSLTSNTFQGKTQLILVR